jgi:hypothetical protein
LDKLDVSEAIYLKEFDFYTVGNLSKINSLIIGEKTELKKLVIQACQIKKLDIDLTKSTKLQRVELDFLWKGSRKGRIKNLDLRNCKELRYLTLSGNKGLSKLDLRKNTKLKELSLTFNKDLTKFDLRKNQQLVSLSLIKYDKLPKNFTLAKNKKLRALYITKKLKKNQLPKSMYKAKSGIHQGELYYYLLDWKGRPDL